MNASNRVCPQCGNASAEAICPVDGWSTVPESLLAERGLVLGSALLGRFRVGALLRHDGAIAVYGGLDERSGHPVHVHLVHVPEGTSLEVVARMQRAAKTLETVRHPALANVLASGMSERGDLAIIAERVTGPTLAEKLRAGPLAPVRTADMGHAIFAGLEVAHAAGVAHHDLTPECIVMPSDDKYVVERIGLFDLLRMSRPANEELAVQPHGMAYGAPEVARDKLVTRQADLYSVGAILYESLTGAPVFDEPTAADRLVAHLTRMPEPPALRGQRLEGPLVELILHCLAKKPWNRPGSATEARVAVENATRGPAAWPIDSEHTPVPRRLLSEPPPLPSFPPVPPPLVTRDAGRPRVDARTRPHLSSASVVVARPKRTLWPWLALAAVLLLCAWPIVASLDRGAPERGGGDQVARERPLPITVHGRAAVDEEKRRADLVRVAAEADAAKAQADADAAKAKADADAAKAQAEARAMAQAEAEAAAAKAKAQAEADTARAQAEVDAAKAKAQAEADAAKAQAEAEAAKAKAEADAAKAEADAAKAKALAEADAAKAKALAEADAAKAKAEADAAKAKAEADAAKAKAEADAAKAKAATNAPKPGKSWRERQAELEAEAKAEEARMAALERKKARAEAERKAQLSRARAVAEAPRDPGGDATPDRSETPPAAAFRRAAVMSVPAGATVTVDGAVVGQTPTVLTWAPGGQGRAIVSLDGYEPRSFDLSEGANGKTVLFELVRKKK